MKAIVAVDKNWGIGKDGDLLCPLKKDLQYFKEKTTGNILILGRKTLESFPDNKPLPNRLHMVLTHNMAYERTEESISIYHSIEDIKKELPSFIATNTKSYAEQEVFVIGGGTIYEQMLSDCDTIYVTKIQKAFEADTYFPNLDDRKEWIVAEESEVYEESDIFFSFVTYQRRG